MCSASSYVFCKDQIMWTIWKHVINAKEQTAKSKGFLVIVLKFIYSAKHRHIKIECRTHNW